MKSLAHSFRATVVVLIAFVVHVSLAKGPPYAKAPPLPAAAPASQPAASVRIENFAFIPKDLEVSVGTTVTWQNADDVPHTATSKDEPPLFDSGPLDTDEKFSFTFTKPGKFAYYCKVHTHMIGSVTVK